MTSWPDMTNPIYPALWPPDIWPVTILAITYLKVKPNPNPNPKPKTLHLKIHANLALPSVSWPPMNFAKLVQISYFFSFPNFIKSKQICSFHWMSKNQKCFSFRWSSPPLYPRPGALPLGLARIIGLRYRARHRTMPHRYCGLEPPRLVSTVIRAGCVFLHSVTLNQHYLYF